VELITVRPRRRLFAAALTISLLAGLSTALPAAAVSGRISITASPRTAYVGSVVGVAGTVTPHAAVAVVVERLVGHAWKVVAHSRTSKAGAYSVFLHAPKTTAAWQLRVVTAATISRTVQVRVVKAAFTVRAGGPASVANGAPIVVNGMVKPRAAGTVALQRFQHNSWHTLATATLTRTSTFTFTFTKTQRSDAYRLRVVKTYTSSTAGGLSKAFTVTVLAPVTAPPITPPLSNPPSVSTTALPAATLGVPYSATVAATGGAAPYAWIATAGTLPPGLTLSSAGHITGRPTAIGISTVTLTVTDSAGHAGSTSLFLSVGTGSGRSWGYNASEQLGNGGVFSSAAPVPISNLTGVTAVAGGQSTGYALTANGLVWAWGDNSQGQLGINSVSTDSAVPALITTLSGVTAIAAGTTSAYALLADGSVWAWGSNSQSELGNGSILTSRLPVQVHNLAHVTAIAALASGGIALESDGTVWSWGPNTSGDLGVGSTMGVSAPVQLDRLSGVTAIAAGATSGYAVLAGGLVAAWGNDSHGQLGDGFTTEQDSPIQVIGLSGVTAVTAGETSAYALSAGHVWSWGDNTDGELGDSTTNDRHVPAQIAGLTGVTAVASGLRSVYALTADGTVWSWGYNGEGELGNGSLNPGLVPTQAPSLAKVVAVGSGPVSNAGYAVTAG
jgi:Putative Ig domain/Regulator of chromosome condensation (RCC1) repeat